jgi:protein-tyrosine-phosphatase
MAEAIFNQKIEEMGLAECFQANSAGTWAVGGIPAPEDGQWVMETMGLDTSSHRSRIVTKEMIDSADLVLTMEAGHKEALQVEFPENHDKVLMLSEIIGPPYDILDPYMRGREKFLETARELDNLLDQGISMICKLANPENRSFI